MAESIPRKLVAAALVLNAQEELLLTQRTATQAHPLQWEFPGGKIEPGEPPDETVRRELREELGIEVTVGRIWDVLHHRYPDFEVLMLVYVARLDPSTPPTCRQVEAFEWLTVDELGEHDMLAADAPLVERLRVEGLPDMAPPVN